MWQTGYFPFEIIPCHCAHKPNWEHLNLGEVRTRYSYDLVAPPILHPNACSVRFNWPTRSGNDPVHYRKRKLLQPASRSGICSALQPEAELTHLLRKMAKKITPINFRKQCNFRKFRFRFGNGFGNTDSRIFLWLRPFVIFLPAWKSHARAHCTSSE